MDEVESDSGTLIAEAMKAGHRDDKSRPGIIAEGEEPLRLRAGDLAAAEKIAHRSRAQRIAAQQTQKKSSAAAATAPKQAAHEGRERPPQHLRAAQRHK